VVAVGVDVEQPGRPAERLADRVDDARSRPSEKFGTDSSGNTFRTLEPGMKAYYHARAREYDDWWLGRNLYAAKYRPGWEDDRAELESWIAGLPAARTLDVACGTGLHDPHLRGEITGLDQSDAMLEVAAEQVPTRPSSWATRSSCPSRTERSTAFHELLLLPPRGGRPPGASSARPAASRASS
jgi:2-polyprenyl-3-methyl-5-hydroxy-6-metoxy-1,4-benzoquinol methylase